MFVIRVFRCQSVSVNLIFGLSSSSYFLGVLLSSSDFSWSLSVVRGLPWYVSVTRAFFRVQSPPGEPGSRTGPLPSTRCSGKAWCPKIAPYHSVLITCEKGEQPGRALVALHAIQRQDLVLGDSAPQRYDQRVREG